MVLSDSAPATRRIDELQPLPSRPPSDEALTQRGGLGQGVIGSLLHIYCLLRMPFPYFSHIYRLERGPKAENLYAEEDGPQATLLWENVIIFFDVNAGVAGKLILLI